MQKGPYRAIIFDFYGVICSRVSNRWMMAHGIAEADARAIADEHVYPADRGILSNEEVFARLGARFNLSPQQIHDEWLEYASINLELVEMITTLKETHKIAVCSNAFNLIRDIFNKTHVDQLFDVVAVSSEVGFAKPDPEMFAYTLDQLGVPAHEAIFTDDAQSNVDAASALGITSFLFTSADQLKKDLAGVGVIA